jgi:hypothetical protein
MKLLIKSAILIAVFMFVACGSSKSEKKSADDGKDPVQGAVPEKDPAKVDKKDPDQAGKKNPGTVGMKDFERISNIPDLWNKLYEQNNVENIIGKSDDSLIKVLHGPNYGFADGSSFDNLNNKNLDGRFEGVLDYSGSLKNKGFVEKKGTTIIFGSNVKSLENGSTEWFKVGDLEVNSGFVDLKEGYLSVKRYFERSGKIFYQTYIQFKRLGDGSMICLYLFGQSMDPYGKIGNRNDFVFVHSGKDRFDFTIGKATIGTEFEIVSIVDKSDLKKTEVIELLKSSGYTLDKTGGIKDGKLVLDK